MAVGESGQKIKGSNPKIAIEWSQLVSGVAEVAVRGFATFFGANEGVNTIAAAVSTTLSSFKVEVGDAERARALVFVSLAWAIEQISADLSEEEQGQALKETRNLLKGTSEKIEKGDYSINSSFFHKPVSLPLYQEIRTSIVELLAHVRRDIEPDPTVLGAKLDAAFNQGVYEVLRDSGGSFDPLKDGLDNPAASANAMEREWEQYRAQLRYAFNVAPVFGQRDTRISLSQLYVPLRGCWTEVSSSNEILNNIVDLERSTLDWISERDIRRPIRLIYGGPGSGKSSFGRRLASVLADHEDIRPIFVPLEHVDLSNELVDEVSRLLVAEAKVFSSSPIDYRQADVNRPFCLIFDGLDELAMPGLAADNLAREVLEEVDKVLKALGVPNACGAMAVITGREPIVKITKDRLKKKIAEQDAVEVLGFLPLQGNGSEPEDPLYQDQRPVWWKRYAIATGQSEEVPEALQSSNLEELSAEPLLCYLLAMSGYTNDNWEDAAINPNRVYDKLFRDIYQRLWGGGAVGVQAELDEDQYDRLMEAIAIAAWWSGESRVASEKDFLNVLTVLNAQSVWEEFCNDQKEDYKNLALTFYLRTSDNGGKGFEFSHRSFGEYLVARALWRAVEEILCEFKPQFYSDALQRWARLTSFSPVTREILIFLRRHVLLAWEGKYEEEKQKILADLMTISIHDGVMVPVSDGDTWRSLEKKQRNSEISLMACYSAATLAVPAEEPFALIDWRGNQFAARSLVERMVFGGGLRIDSGLQMLKGIDFLGKDKTAPWMVGTFMYEADLSYANLSGGVLGDTDFSGGLLIRANLSKTILNFSNFNHSVLMHADLSGSQIAYAQLQGADLYRANMENCDLEQANLTDGILRSANLKNAVIQGADLSEAILVDANLEGANLSQANLKIANLESARLVGANLDEANLKDANLKNSNLEGASLQGADLRNANLEGANLQGADLDNANLEGANLQGANLDNANLERALLGAESR
ncbi:MAG: pentapeptide repeat-containing protein [Thalassospira sp.]|uniref:pentapeptide repeat-containing protein n=1 Tax=Thalassospira sp. TaxID=1912094 RepID=UPI003A843E2C